MNARARISVAAATGLLDAIAAAGGNPDQILRTVGLERSVLATADAFIASTTFSWLLEEASRATGDKCFGLHFGEHFDPKDIGVLAYVVVNSPTIALAIQNIARYVTIHSSAARVSFGIEGERGYLRSLLARAVLHSRRQHNEFTMAVLVKTFRIVATSDWAPLEIQFAHEAPAESSEHSRFFACKVLFDCATNALVVDRDFVHRPVPAADEKLYRILKQYVERILSEMPRHNDFLDAVRKAIGESLGEGESKRTRIADKMSMSGRTLERRLNAHGVVYRKLLDDMRRQFALNYLRDTRHTLTEVAFLLGYSEVSAFNRAFKRWTGSTPLEYRHKAIREAAPVEPT